MRVFCLYTLCKSYIYECMMLFESFCDIRIFVRRKYVKVYRLRRLNRCDLLSIAHEKSFRFPDECVSIYIYTRRSVFVKHSQLIYYVLSVPFRSIQYLRKCNCVPENNIPEMHSAMDPSRSMDKKEQEDQTTLRIQGYKFTERIMCFLLFHAMLTE